MNTNHSFSEKFRGLIERSQFLSQPKSLKIRPLFFGTLGLLLMAATQATGQVSSAKVPLKNAIALDGQSIHLKPQAGQALTLIFYSTQCPIANAYSNTLSELAKTFPENKARFIGVCVDPDLTKAQILAHSKEFGWNFPILHDTSGKLVSQFGAKVTPEVFVVDASGQVQYQGRIDDQFAARQKRNPNPQKHELKDALTAVTSGQPVAIALTTAIGCPVPELKEVVAKPIPTYSREISRIIQKNCQECHSKGQIGPFPLETYEHARKRASDLANVTSGKLMPPWKPQRGFGRAMKHDRSLAEADIQAFADWSEAGAPLGNIADMPAPVSFATDWKLGTPDMVLQLPAGYVIPATGPDLYRCFVLPTNLPDDRYISAVEFKPDNRKVVHHILGWVDVSGEGRKKDELEPGPGYISFVGADILTHSDISGWAAGRGPTILPEGAGYSIPKKSDVILQLHYHPSGKPETDRSQVGLYFSRKPIKAALHRTAANNTDITIAAGAKNHEIKAEWVIPTDVVAHFVSPHMHLVGKDMKMSVTFPDGHVEDLIHIPNWDFNWQSAYEFEKPMDLPKGSILKVVAHYDNSSENPTNPNSPPKEIKWGPATYDEMCVGFISLTKKDQDLTLPGEKNDLGVMIQNANRAKDKAEKAKILSKE